MKDYFQGDEAYNFTEDERAQAEQSYERPSVFFG